MDVILFQPGNGIKGESNIEGYTESIQLLSMSHGFSMQITTDVSNTARTSGKPNIQDIACVKYMDASSFPLYNSCLTGTSLGQSTITMGRNGGGGFEKLLVITLYNPLVSSMSMQANPGDMPTETFTLNFSGITWEYTVQKIDATAGGAVTSSWNLATNNPNV